MKPSKKLQTNILNFKVDGENVTKPTILKTDFATCVKCGKQFIEEEWDIIEKNTGWHTIPNKPNFEALKIRCSTCNQLNIWTRSKR